MPVERWHVDHVVAAMREADRREIRILNGCTPREGIEQSLAQPGKHWAGLIDGEPVAIFGVVPVTLVGNAAVIWMLGTDAILRHWRVFARYSRLLMPVLLDQYDVLLNVVHVDNRVALRWLAWMGATFRRNQQQVYFEIRGKR